MPWSAAIDFSRNFGCLRSSLQLMGVEARVSNDECHRSEVDGKEEPQRQPVKDPKPVCGQFGARRTQGAWANEGDFGRNPELAE